MAPRKVRPISPRILRLPPLGTLRWWGHRAVETLARGIVRPQVLPLLRQSALATLERTGSAAPAPEPNDPPEHVAVAAPQIAVDARPARFAAAVSSVVAGYDTDESRTWTLRDASFSLPAGIVTVEGRVPAETLVQRIWPHSYQYLPLLKLARSPGEEVPPGCAFTFPHWNNIYHWLAVMLPLALVLREQTELPLYVPRGGPRFTTEALELLGLADRCVQLDDGIYRCESLTVASIPGHGIDRPSPRHVHHVRRALLERVDADPGARRRVYVSRGDAGDRRVLNEDAVVAALAELGFEAVTLGDLSFGAQLRLFAEAEIVIGAHGAGLANAVVTPESAWLLELVGDKVVNPMYAALASIVGARYGYVRVADSYRDHVVAVPDVLEAVRKALPELTTPAAATAPA
jgi:glycosyl transferase family 61